MDANGDCAPSCGNAGKEKAGAAEQTTNDGRTNTFMLWDCSHFNRLGEQQSSPLGGKAPTGEPDAGDPPVRLGGRGEANQVLPTPINKASIRHQLQMLAIRIACGPGGCDFEMFLFFCPKDARGLTR